MPVAWTKVLDFQDIKYEHFEGIAKVTINRPEVRNAFRPETVSEMQAAFAHARDDSSMTPSVPAATSASAAMAATSILPGGRA